MTGWAELEAHTAELNAAIETLISQSRNSDETRNASQPLVPPESPAQVHRARRTIMANLAKLQTLFAEPADFLQELARQVGLSLLFQLRWSIPTPKLTGIVSAEPISRLHKLARRVPSPRLYTAPWQRSIQRRRRACWGARNAAPSNRADDCERWLPL